MEPSAETTAFTGNLSPAAKSNCSCLNRTVRTDTEATSLLQHLRPIGGDRTAAREFACPVTLTHWMVSVGTDGHVRLDPWRPGPLIPVG